MRTSLRWTVPTFLALQLGLLWIQGAQLHRQNQVLQGLREDVQALTESLDSNPSATSKEDDGGAVPARLLARPVAPRQIAVLGVEEEQEAAARDLKASKDSAQKAIKDAREIQSKLSIEENIRKADEAQKVQAATTSWQRWVWGAIALVVLALVVRSVLQRRS